MEFSEVRVEIIVAAPIDREVHEYIESLDFKVVGLAPSKLAIKYRSNYEISGLHEVTQVAGLLEDSGAHVIELGIGGKP